MRGRLAICALLGASGCFEDPSTRLDASGGDEDAQSEATAAGSSSGTPAGSDGPIAPGESSDDTTASPPDTSSEGAPVATCGDGELDEDELCDDGNDVPADGCTACQPSLTTTWVRSFGSAYAHEGALSIATREGEIVVAGSLGGTADDGDVWLELLDDAGTSQGRLLVGGEAEQDDAAIDVRYAAKGTVWATGQLLDGGTAGTQIDTRKLTGALEIDWTAQAGGGLQDARGLGIAIVDDGAVVGAVLGAPWFSNAWLGRYDDAGTLVDHYECDCGPFGAVLDIASSPGAVRAIAETNDGFALWGFDGEIGEGPSWTVPIDAMPSSLVLDTAPDGDTIVAGSIDMGNDVGVWLARIDPDGDLLWTATHDLGDGDQSCLDLAIGLDTFTVVGALRQSETVALGIVARLELGTGDPLLVQELTIEDSADTRITAIDLGGPGSLGPTIAGAYAVDELDDDAFVARLVP